MTAYIRSKTTNADEEITIQLGASTARLNQSGNFKLPHAVDADRSGIVRYNSETDKMEFNDDIELNNNELVGLGAPTMASSAANKSYVDTSIASAIASLVDGAPLVLDTLNELAAAIGDNANFVTDINASIASKLPLAGGTLTGALILNDNPVSALGAATKEYVDNLVNGQMIYSTSDVPEGSGLYYTEARARDAISVSGSLSYDSEQGIISYTTPVSNINSLSDVDTITRAPVVGEALVWDGSNWVPGASVTAVLADASLDGGSFD